MCALFQKFFALRGGKRLAPPPEPQEADPLKCSHPNRNPGKALADGYIEEFYFLFEKFKRLSFAKASKVANQI